MKLLIALLTGLWIMLCKLRQVRVRFPSLALPHAYRLNRDLRIYPVQNCLEVVMLLWNILKDTPRTSNDLFTEVALAYNNIKRSPHEGPSDIVEAWASTYDAILSERGDQPPTCGHCGMNRTNMQQCSRCKIAEYCSRECQISYVPLSCNTLSIRSVSFPTYSMLTRRFRARKKHKSKCIQNPDSS